MSICVTPSEDRFALATGNLQPGTDVDSDASIPVCVVRIIEIHDQVLAARVIDMAIATRGAGMDHEKTRGTVHQECEEV
jgi:hypothetical protein